MNKSYNTIFSLRIIVVFLMLVLSDFLLGSQGEFGSDDTAFETIEDPELNEKIVEAWKKVKSDKNIKLEDKLVRQFIKNKEIQKEFLQHVKDHFDLMLPEGAIDLLDEYQPKYIENHIMDLDGLLFQYIPSKDPATWHDDPIAIIFIFYAEEGEEWQTGTLYPKQGANLSQLPKPTKENADLKLIVDSKNFKGTGVAHPGDALRKGGFGSKPTRHAHSVGGRVTAAFRAGFPKYEELPRKSRDTLVRINAARFAQIYDPNKYDKKEFSQEIFDRNDKENFLDHKKFYKWLKRLHAEVKESNYDHIREFYEKDPLDVLQEYIDQYNKLFVFDEC